MSPSIIPILLLLLLFVRAPTAIPSQAFSHNTYTPRRTLSSSHSKRKGRTTHPNPLHHSHQTWENDHTVFSKRRLPPNSNHQPQHIDKRTVAVRKHSTIHTHSNDSFQHHQPNPKNDSLVEQDAMVSGFFRSVARFFGFGGNQSDPDSPESPTIDQDQITKHHATQAGTTEIVDDLELENAEEEAPSMVSDSQRTESQVRRNVHHKVRKWNDEDTMSDANFDMQDTSDRGSESAHHMQKTDRTAEEPQKNKDTDDLFSETDLKDMVRLFKRLFASLENVLQEKSDSDSSRTSTRPINAKPKRNYESADRWRRDEEDEETSGEESVSFGKASRSHRERDTHDELPDVRVALAEAEQLNRVRDEERHAKFIDESVEHVTERPHGRASKYSSSGTGSGRMDDEEDAPADEVEADAFGQLPKSSPSYGSRKKLLAATGRHDSHNPRQGLYNRMRRRLRAFF